MSEKENDKAAEKRDRFEQWMKGDHVLVHLNAKIESVEVPLHHQGNPALTLKLSYFFQGETTHDELGIVSYLKFDGQYNRCVLPWSAIWGFTNSAGETQLWTEDVPREVYLQMARSKLVEVGKRLLGAKSGKGEGGNEQDNKTSADGAPPSKQAAGKSEEGSSKKTSHLKRIK